MADRFTNNLFVCFPNLQRYLHSQDHIQQFALACLENSDWAELVHWLSRESDITDVAPLPLPAELRRIAGSIRRRVDQTCRQISQEQLERLVERDNDQEDDCDSRLARRLASWLDNMGLGSLVAICLRGSPLDKSALETMEIDRATMLQVMRKLRHLATDLVRRNQLGEIDTPALDPDVMVYVDPLAPRPTWCQSDPWTLPPLSVSPADVREAVVSGWISSEAYDCWLAKLQS